MGRIGADRTAATARARGTAAALDDQALLRAEVLAALWETDGRRAADAAAFGEALAAYADGAPDAHDRRVRREGFARRFLLDAALAATPG